MTISVGDRLPSATFSRIGESGPEQVDLATLTKGRKLVLFGLPGAFTRTCSATHLPSFIRTAEALRAAGADDIACISVNDPFVMQAWDEAAGASKAGILMLADGDSGFTRQAGLAFSMPELGFIDRCTRFSAYAVDGVVRILDFEDRGGVCVTTAGENLLAQIEAL